MCPNLVGMYVLLFYPLDSPLSTTTPKRLFPLMGCYRLYYLIVLCLLRHVHTVGDFMVILNNWMSHIRR